ncbi:MAG: hypothetical protein EPO06_03260 [Burkholderiaceae bacterium]|nr:MAG: hypothetical protein EPO06_03260 [Burkholderiaceae bacterium]
MINPVSAFSYVGTCRGLPGGKLLFFASPKKSNQKKGEPPTLPLRGSRKNSIQNRKRKNSPSLCSVLKQFSFLICFELNFCGSIEAGI